MSEVARVRVDDWEEGDWVTISVEKEGEEYWVRLSNGDDSGLPPQDTEEGCIEEIISSWGFWETFVLYEEN